MAPEAFQWCQPLDSCDTSGTIKLIIITIFVQSMAALTTWQWGYLQKGFSDIETCWSSSDDYYPRWMTQMSDIDGKRGVQIPAKMSPHRPQTHRHGHFPLVALPCGCSMKILCCCRTHCFRIYIFVETCGLTKIRRKRNYCENFN